MKPIARQYLCQTVAGFNVTCTLRNPDNRKYLSFKTEKIIYLPTTPPHLQGTATHFLAPVQ